MQQHGADGSSPTIVVEEDALSLSLSQQSRRRNGRGTVSAARTNRVVVVVVVVVWHGVLCVKERMPKSVNVVVVVGV